MKRFADKKERDAAVISAWVEHTRAHNDASGNTRFWYINQTTGVPRITAYQILQRAAAEMCLQLMNETHYRAEIRPSQFVVWEVAFRLKLTEGQVEHAYTFRGSTVKSFSAPNPKPTQEKS
jgi:hypothetical protein